MGWETEIDRKVAIVTSQMDAARKLAVEMGSDAVGAEAPYRNLIADIESDRADARRMDAEESRRSVQ